MFVNWKSRTERRGARLANALLIPWEGAVNEKREKRIRDVIAKHVPREADQDEIWLVIDDAVDEERWEAYSDGEYNERVYSSYPD